ncbi:MAG TPA: FAD-binding oxidoreductase [Patescibacteria group bacterium]|jgi:FAD/FMN-containing dehydrogenase|nr:FAD-binding oxidoreductase [Patescibacteria group bacterium]
MTVSSPRPGTTTPLDLQSLRGRIDGRVIGPTDDDYDTARAVMFGGIDRHPAAIVRVSGVGDVRAVIETARETGLELAIRSGGHSAKGDSTTEGGIVLDLGDMASIEIDPASKTAWVEAGATALAVAEAAAQDDLAIGFGDTGSVGVGGITTGGGVGYLGRKYGLTIDNLLAAEVVTADGELRQADADTNPDLFWAIRGGGGNFGVVTRFRFRLIDLPTIVGGMLFLPATAETIERFMTLSAEAPAELGTIANVMPCPPMPFVDEKWHGKVVIFALVCWAGDAASGEKTLRELRDLAQLGGLDAPIADMLQVGPYTLMYPPEDPDYHPLAVSLTGFLDRVDRPTAETMLNRLESLDAPMRVVQLRVVGGAIARVPDDATAYSHRQSEIMVNVAAFYEGDHDKAQKQAWVEELMAAIHQSDDGAYVNFVGDEGEARVRAAYPRGTYERLAEIKRRYDPENLFRLNQNIPPA